MILVGNVPPRPLLPHACLLPASFTGGAALLPLTRYKGKGFTEAQRNTLRVLFPGGKVYRVLIEKLTGENPEFAMIWEELLQDSKTSEEALDSIHDSIRPRK